MRSIVLDKITAFIDYRQRDALIMADYTCANCAAETDVSGTCLNGRCPGRAGSRDGAAGQQWGTLVLNLAVNIMIPAVILMKFSGAAYLGPVRGLLAALAFPVLYGLYDGWTKKNLNFYSLVGFVSIVLTGGIGLLKLDVGWLAVKEAAVPLLIGLAVIGSLKTRWPFIKTLLASVLDEKRISEALRRKGTARAYEQRLVYATYLVGGAFLVSAVLNYVLAKVIVVSPPGTSAFNEQLGKLTALSYPVIAVPSLLFIVLAVLYVIYSIVRLTDLELDSIIR